ncbi:MAG: glycosyltransferase family 4 protein [Planctomycetota bacterium]|nr:glycosyltransferase family 4 protein [Planctomycetota bacterium]
MKRDPHLGGSIASPDGLVPDADAGPDLGRRGAPPEMRALHLFSNYKWTGPADPAIRSAAALRDLGVDVMFAQSGHQVGETHYIGDKVRARNLPLIAGLQLPKHHSMVSLYRDSAVLAQRLRREDFNLLHTHLLGDHLPAVVARRRVRTPTVVVRSLYDPEPPARFLRNRWAFAGTDGVVVPTDSCAEAFVRRYKFAEQCVLVQEPPTDGRRLQNLTGDQRQRWGIGPADPLIGITARIQSHRRFGFLWQVVRRVVDQVPRARFVLLGRGNATDVEEQVSAPIKALGLGDSVILPGYQEDPDYSLWLRSLDLFTFMVPGSDGTCRAVREAMAAGLPVVSSKRGILPQLLGRRAGSLAEDACGLLIEDDVELMSAALVGLIKNPDACARLRTAALDRVAKLMDERIASRRLRDFYHQLMGGS